MTTRRGWLSLIGAVLRRPRLWIEALRSLASVRRHARPWPSRAYLDWRFKTAYGAAVPAHPEDLVRFIEWRVEMRRLSRWRA